MDVGGASEDADSGPLIMSEWMLVLSARLLVLPEAWDGWAALHVKPCNGFAYSMIAFFFSAVWSAWSLNAASRPVGWVVLSASITSSVCHSTLFLLVWRYGPMISKTKIYHTIGLAMSAAQTWICLRLLFWRGDYVPFGSHLLFAMVVAVGMWATTVAGALGCWAQFHPAQPYRSYSGPVLAATTCILRMADAFTDLLIIQLMLEKAKEPCYWFGAEGACARWRVMAVCAGVSAALDLVISISVAFSGFSFKKCDVDAWKRRCARFLMCLSESRPWWRGPAAWQPWMFIRAHVASFLCEVSILAVTLVKLFSDFQEPATNKSAAEHRNAVTLTLGSFAVTVASFGLTMLGMKTVLAAVARVSVQVRDRISKASVRSSHPADAGQLQAVEAEAAAGAEG